MLIELALWEPLNIAQTGRKLGINSDARYRFERGVDPAFMVPGLELATQMVLDLCGGTPSEIAVAGDPQVPERVDRFPARRRSSASPASTCRRRRCARVLGRLGFFVAGAGRDREGRGAVLAAGRRGKADIVEEVVRIVGVDRVPSTPFDRGDAPRKPVLTPCQVRTRKAKRALAARGLVEAVTWSFIAEAAGGAVRRRQAGARARQSDRGRPLRHAAEPAARA